MGQMNPVIREFVPSWRDVSNNVEMPGGILSVRTDDYSTRMPKMKQLADLLIGDALQFEPPLEIDPEDVSIVIYGGDRIKKIPGIEVRIPSGYVVSQQYVQRQTSEFTIAGN